MNSAAMDRYALPLSRRQKQVLQLVTCAKPNKEIAFELSLSEGTVKVYLRTLFIKFNVKSRTELAVMAIRNQIC